MYIMCVFLHSPHCPQRKTNGINQEENIYIMLIHYAVENNQYMEKT